MVKVISTVPHPSVVKEAICKHCGSTLQYTPMDVKEQSYRDYDGSQETLKTITCPTCTYTVFVK